MTPFAIELGPSDHASGSLSAPPQVRRLPVRDGYALWAASYDADPNPLLALEGRVLELLLGDVRTKDAIDLGCGTGRWLRKLLRRGVRSALGVDFTPQMLGRAALDPSLSRRLVLGDCAALPFRSQSADLVVCSFTLGHIQDLGALADEVARISRPPAELFLSDLHPEAHIAGWRCAFLHEGTRIEIGSHSHARARVHKAFQSAGFALRQSLDAFVGETERHIFVDGGKGGMFDAARGVPALAIEHLSLAGNA